MRKNILMKNIDEIINKALEQKRAIAVKMVIQGFTYEQISELLNVSSFFINKYRALYNKQGAKCFTVKYHGSACFLTKEQLKEVDKFINTKSSCHLEALIAFIKKNFKVVFKSKQTYYDLLHKAGMNWKKTEKNNPKKDNEKVALKQNELKKNSIPKMMKFSPGIWSY